MMNKTVQPHVQRVIDEKKELDSKRISLELFLKKEESKETNLLNRNSKIGQAKFSLLQDQLVVMEHYSRILNARLKLED